MAVDNHVKDEFFNLYGLRALETSYNIKTVGIHRGLVPGADQALGHQIGTGQAKTQDEVS
jgi:hypothetical protein